MNQFVYCSNDPVGHTDPTGQDFTLDSVGKAIGIGAIVAVPVLAYRSLTYADRQMKKILTVAIAAEIQRDMVRQDLLQRIISEQGKIKFRDLGLGVGGRLSIRMKGDSAGQDIRDLWESPANYHGWVSGYGEAGSRTFAGRSAQGGFAIDENNMTDDEREVLAEGLLARHKAYVLWMKNFVK